jgi:uncharacterized protein with PQ loop repeat
VDLRGVCGVSAGDLLGTAAGVFGVGMGLSPLLQLRRLRRTGSAEDLSLGAQAVIATGAGTWLAYGVCLGNLAVVATNAAGVCASSACLAVGLVLRRRVLSRREAQKGPAALRAYSQRTGHDARQAHDVITRRHPVAAAQ